jgi:hypothetical protein
MIKQKKADSRLLTPWLFVVFAIVGIGIVLGVIIFYDVESDVRVGEARFLTNMIIEGVIENGYLKEKVFERNFDLLQEARINKAKLAPGGDFFVSMIILKDDEPIKEFSAGTRDLVIQCSLEGKGFAKCYETKLIVLNQSNPPERLLVRIIGASNQQ